MSGDVLHGRGAAGVGRAGRPAGRLLAVAVLILGLLCAAGYLLTHPLHDTAFERWDESVNRLLARHRTDTWNTITHYLTYAAETVTVVAIGAGLFVGLRLALGRWRESLFVAIALAGEVTIFVVTTVIIDRTRPRVPHLDDAPPTSSFPSGHTAASVALYGTIALLVVRLSHSHWQRVLAVIFAVVVPAGVAAARLYRGMHFPTDVMHGALLSVLWLTAVWVVVLRGRPAHPGRGVRASVRR